MLSYSSTEKRISPLGLMAYCFLLSALTKAIPSLKGAITSLIWAPLLSPSGIGIASLFSLGFTGIGESDCFLTSPSLAAAIAWSLEIGVPP